MSLKLHDLTILGEIYCYKYWKIFKYYFNVVNLIKILIEPFLIQPLLKS